MSESGGEVGESGVYVVRLSWNRVCRGVVEGRCVLGVKWYRVFRPEVVGWFVCMYVCVPVLFSSAQVCEVCVCF